MAGLHNIAVQHRLGDVLAEHLAAANMLGRMQILDEVRRKTGKRLPLAMSSRMNRRHLQFAEQLASDGSGYDPEMLLPAGFSTNLPPDRAAEYLRNLTPVTRATFDGLTAQYQHDAFTIAGVSDVRLIKKIRDELAAVLQAGGTRKDFQAAAQKLATEAGATELNAFTLDTVFNTNMHKAYALGRYEQLEDADVIQALPFREYLTVGDDRVRPEHADIDGFQAKAVDPVWRKIYPPNGFNCRCIVIALLAEEAGESASEDGYMRLPARVIAMVPQPGFSKVFAMPRAA